MKLSTVMAMAIAGAALCVASAVQAKSAECLWDNLSPAARNAVLAQAANESPSAAQEGLPGKDRVTVRDACGYQSSPSEALGGAWAGIAYQRISEDWLARNQGYTPARLNAAWERTNPKVKARLDELTRAHATDPVALDAARGSFARAMGLKKAPAQEVANSFLTYVGGRTLRAIFEPQL